MTSVRLSVSPLSPSHCPPLWWDENHRVRPPVSHQLLPGPRLNNNVPPHQRRQSVCQSAPKQAICAGIIQDSTYSKKDWQTPVFSISDRRPSRLWFQGVPPSPPLGNDLRGPPSEQQEALDYLPDRGCALWRTGSWVVHGKIDLLSFPSSFIQYELKNKGLKTFTYIYHIYIYMKGHFVSSPSTKYPPISQKVISHFFFLTASPFWAKTILDISPLWCHQRQSGASYLSYFCTLQNTL